MFLETTFFNLAIGLIILMLANIALGSVTSLFEKAFDYVKFFKGIAKGLLVAVAVVGTYWAGSLNPDILAITLDGQQLNIMAAIEAAILGGYFLYGKQVIEKIMTLINEKKTTD